MGLLTAQTVKKFEFPKSKMRDQTRGNVVAGAAGEVNGALRGRNMAKTSISITTSGLTEPDVVLR